MREIKSGQFQTLLNNPSESYCRINSNKKEKSIPECTMHGYRFICDNGIGAIPKGTRFL